MKKTKRFLSILLSVVLMCISVLPCFAEQSDYDFLLSCGYSAEFLDKLPREYHSKLREVISDYDATVIESSDENISISRGAIDESDLDLEIEAIELCQTGTNIINGYAVTVSWVWAKDKPVNTSNQDAMTVNWNADLLHLTEDGFYSQDWYKTSSSGEEIINRECTVASSSSQGGVGFYTELEGNYPFVGGAALIVLETAVPMYTGTTYSSSINLEYAHDFSLWGIGGAGFTVGPVGVSLDCGNLCDTMADSKTIRYSN